jgi:hypothetical protein
MPTSEPPLNACGPSSCQIWSNSPCISLYQKVSIWPHSIPFLTLAYLRIFGIVNLQCLTMIFKNVEFPILNTIHLAFPPEDKDQWLSQPSPMSLLSYSSSTLRKLQIDVPENSVHIAHRLRTTPSLTELSLLRGRVAHCRSTSPFYSPAVY